MMMFRKFFLLVSLDCEKKVSGPFTIGAVACLLPRPFHLEIQAAL